jgi:hypothetical protein
MGDTGERATVRTGDDAKHQERKHETEQSDAGYEYRARREDNVGQRWRHQLRTAASQQDRPADTADRRAANDSDSD